MSLSLNCQFSVWSVKISKTNQFVVTKNQNTTTFTCTQIQKFMYISFSYSIHGRNKVKGSGEILWYSRGQSPNLLSNSIQISKCTKIWGRVVIDRFNNFFWLSLCKKKKQYYLCHSHPNHKYSSVWLRTGGCHVDSSTIGSKESDSNWTFAVFKSGLSNAYFLYIFHSF